MFAINTTDNLNVTTTNIPVALLNTKMEYTVRVQLDNILSEMILNIDTKKYRDKVVIKKRKKVIYAVLKIALCRD